MYLELVYQDLLASAGITLPPCNSGSSSSGSSGSGKTGIGGTSDSEEGCYCQGYNLLMTSQVSKWMEVRLATLYLLLPFRLATIY